MAKNYINKVFLDKFKVESEITGGEYEHSFVGKDLKNNQPVHIRIIPIDTDHPELLEQSQNFVFKEVSLLQRLNFPGLPVFIESISDREENVIITDFSEGSPLSEKLEKQSTCSEEEVIDFLNKLLPILDYLHSQTPPVIYRDLQPKNIFYDPKGSLFLTKYEAARTYKADKIKDTIIHASRGYSPPEQAFGKGQSDARSDIYSVGMIVFQMFTGKDPTKAPLILPKISDIRKDVNPMWSAIASKATNIKVDKRYSSVKEVMKDLENMKAGKTAAEVEKEAPKKVAPDMVKPEEPKKKITIEFEEAASEKKEEKAPVPAPVPSGKEAEKKPEVKPEEKKAEEKKPEVKPEPVPAKAEPEKQPVKEEKKAEEKKPEVKPEPVPAKAEPGKQPVKEEKKPEPPPKKEEKKAEEKPSKQEPKKEEKKEAPKEPVKEAKKEVPSKREVPSYSTSSRQVEEEKIPWFAYFMLLIDLTLVVILGAYLATNPKSFNAFGDTNSISLTIGIIICAIIWIIAWPKAPESNKTNKK